MKLISRFGVLLLGIVFCILAYYFNDRVSVSMFFSSFGGIFILIGLLVATRSSMLGFGKNLQIFNGIGTTLYGKSNFDKNDQSYIATKWLVFICLPIFPLASYRVIKIDAKSVPFGTTTNYQMKDTPINKVQIIKTYVTTYGLIVLIVTFLYYLIK